jgi:hypothetical protein
MCRPVSTGSWTIRPARQRFDAKGNASQQRRMDRSATAAVSASGSGPKALRADVELGYIQLARRPVKNWRSDRGLDGYRNWWKPKTWRAHIAADIIDLKITNVLPSGDRGSSEFSRILQDTVIDRGMPWLKDWAGRPTDR